MEGRKQHTQREREDDTRKKVRMKQEQRNEKPHGQNKRGNDSKNIPATAD